MYDWVLQVFHLELWKLQAGLILCQGLMFLNNFAQVEHKIPI
jgi:hypothetical protein